MNKYLNIVSVHFWNHGSNQRDVLIRSAFYFVIVYIISSLWAMTRSDTGSFNGEVFIWYIAITELIVLSNPLIYFDIECDIRSGNVVYYLTRPMHYITFRICENIGAYCYRFLFLGIGGILFCYLLNPKGMPSLSHLTVTYLMAFLAGIVLLICHTMIGLSAFKFQDCTPLFWLWQRSSFLLGGLLLPLDFYPSFLQKIAKWTPFEALLYGPESLIYHNSFEYLSLVFAKLCCWGAISLFCCYAYYHRAIKQLEVNGG